MLLDLVDHVIARSLVPEYTEIVSHLHALGAAQIHENDRTCSGDLARNCLVVTIMAVFLPEGGAKASNVASWYAGAGRAASGPDNVAPLHQIASQFQFRDRSLLQDAHDAHLPDVGVHVSPWRETVAIAT